MDILCQNDLSLITSTKSSSEAYNKGPKISTSFGLRLEKMESAEPAFDFSSDQCKVSGQHPSEQLRMPDGRKIFLSILRNAWTLAN